MATFDPSIPGIFIIGVMIVIIGIYFLYLAFG